MIVLFITAQFFFMYKGIQNIPFFLYHMYATPHFKQDSIRVVLIKTNKGYFNTFTISNRQAELLTNNIGYYLTLKNNQFKDPLNTTVEKRFSNRFSTAKFKHLQQSIVNDSAAIARFPVWWQHYFESVNIEPYDSVSIVLSYVRYSPSFLKLQVDSVIFTAYYTP